MTRFVTWRESGWEECSFLHSTESFLLPGSSTTTSRCSAHCVVFDIVPVFNGMVPLPTLVAEMSFFLWLLTLCRLPMPCRSCLKTGQFTSADHTLKGPSVYQYCFLTCPGYFQFTTTVLLFFRFYFTCLFIISPSWPPFGIFMYTFSPSRNHAGNT